MIDRARKIVDSLRKCADNGVHGCPSCAFNNMVRCTMYLMKDAANHIEHLSVEQDALVLEIERLRKELEAAKKDIKSVLETYWLQFTTTPCEFCKHAEDKQRESICFQCGRKRRFFSENWEWRGLCAENGGANNGKSETD